MPLGIAEALARPPDVLVLGGGGILGEAWMLAVLAGLEDAAGVDFRDCGSYIGTSAGSIVSAALVAGVRPSERLGSLPEPPEVAEPEAAGGASALGNLLRLGLAASGSVAAPVAALTLRSTALGGAFVRRIALNRVPAGRRSLGGLGRALEQAGARFDGRLSVSAVQLDTGRRVMFGTEGAPQASVGQAVEASCSIPGVFKPIRVDGHAYVDGGAWSPTNMDTADVRRGTRVLCLNPTGAVRAVGPLSRSAAAVEALTLEGRGAKVKTVSPDAGSSSAMGANLMDAGPREQVIAAGFAQGVALATE
ncbi:MAG: patatin-like phospholipase family protein [Thermoleophilaceae bacterium]